MRNPHQSQCPNDPLNTAVAECAPVKKIIRSILIKQPSVFSQDYIFSRRFLKQSRLYGRISGDHLLAKRKTIGKIRGEIGSDFRIKCSVFQDQLRPLRQNLVCRRLRLAFQQHPRRRYEADDKKRCDKYVICDFLFICKSPP